MELFEAIGKIIAHFKLCSFGAPKCVLWRTICFQVASADGFSS